MGERKKVGESLWLVFASERYFSRKDIENLTKRKNIATAQVAVFLRLGLQYFSLGFAMFPRSRTRKSKNP